MWGLNKNRRNGNQSQGIPAGSPPLNTFLNNVQSQHQFPNVLRDFVHPGKDPRDLLMRTYFKNIQELNCSILMLYKIKEFNMGSDYEELVLNRMAGSPSIGGMARRELLQASTGVVAPTLYGKGGAQEPNRVQENNREGQGV